MFRKPFGGRGDDKATPIISLEKKTDSSWLAGISRSLAAVLRIPCALDETGFPINYPTPGHCPTRGSDSSPKVS